MALRGRMINPTQFNPFFPSLWPKLTWGLVYFAALTLLKQLASLDHIFCRCFNDDERQLFKKGSRDGFLMSVAHPLGSLDYLRIWTDSSGLGDSLLIVINLRQPPLSDTLFSLNTKALERSIGWI